jgi:tRNA A-37 threonylcarbamoyl transferase component Bud32
MTRPFRFEHAASPSVPPSRDLEELLRERLRLISLIWAAATGMISVTGAVENWRVIRATPFTAFTVPPSPGLGFLVAALTLGSAAVLSLRSRLGVARLRAIEWLGVTLMAAYFVLLLGVDLRYILPDLAHTPGDLGFAHGSAWGLVIVGYGVLVPSTGREGAVRTGALVLCAFLADFFVLTTHAGPIQNIGVYLAAKATSVGAFAALAIYGAHRIDVMRQDAHQARQLGQYVLKERLGEGGMGEVYLAEHQFLRRPCAVKLIRPDQAGDANTLQRFEREVQATATLTHPNTIQIYDYGHAEDGTFFYAMEYLPGTTLDDLVERDGALLPARVVHILAQLCGALSEAHNRGLVHRDIKPGNIMLCERGGVHDVAKLLDFGLVAAVRPESTDPKLTQTGMSLGTPAFMSPEQCGGDEEAATPAGDIYSVGALGYFLLTGKAPFAGRSPIQMIAAHLYEKPRPVTDLRPEIPQPLAAVIARCLEKKSEDRFPDAASLEGALVDAIGADCWTARDAERWWQDHAGGEEV